MQKVGLGFVFVGAIAWIITGVVFFTADSRSSLITEGLVEGDPQMLAANAYIGLSHGLYGSDQDPVAHSEEAWSGTYYNPISLDYEYHVPASMPAWYVDVFNGFGSLFDQLFPSKFSTWGSVTVPAPSYEVHDQDTLSGVEPACVVTITPSTVEYGGSATLSWTSRGADKVILQGHGEVARSGSLAIKYLTSTRAFALAVGGEGGSSSCYTVINVEALITPSLSAE